MPDAFWNVTVVGIGFWVTFFTIAIVFLARVSDLVVEDFLYVLTTLLLPVLKMYYPTK